MSWKKPIVYGSAAVTIVGAAYLTKDYLGGARYKGEEELNNKIIIVTGANTGIGYETVRELARRKAKVIMACRDMQKCEKSRREIVIDTKNKYVYCRKCDLASQESIRKFVKRFRKEYDKLDILVNNAGVMRCPKSYTKEGIEMQLGVNHIGHFLLTNLLLDVLKESAPSRIINLSSAAYHAGQINMKDLNSDIKYDSGKAYAQSKLANVLFTTELADRLKGTGVNVYAIHPGIVDTDIIRHMRVLNNIFTRIFLKPFVWPFIKAPVQAAQTVLYAALDPSITDASGSYIDNSTIKELSENAKDKNLAKWLWKVSESWTKLNVT
ncbi:retinol dehydrogenase 13-like [Odontomachus brunneus]|uniref:retinol dehydrogenase 13-like n=1 Tax=Odontomachus brunneus TaxID=486640 RepID=UPI0013F2267A|nr:retinol dehydrogenase 13-like [Odontomachus brunneus]